MEASAAEMSGESDAVGVGFAQRLVGDLAEHRAQRQALDRRVQKRRVEVDAVAVAAVVALEVELSCRRKSRMMPHTARWVRLRAIAISWTLQLGQRAM